MNAEQIRSMEAGRELDALVAEKVMQSHRWTETPPDYDGKFGGDRILMPKDLTWDEASPFLPPRGPIGHIHLHHHSTDIAAAWEVVEKVTEPAPHIGNEDLPPNTKFMLAFQRGHLWAMDAREAAETISKWALLAVMGAE